MQTVVSNFEASDYNFNLIGTYGGASAAFTGVLQGEGLKEQIDKFKQESKFNLKSVRGVKVVAESEMEHVYGTGALPRAIGVGNVKYSGEIKLLKAELLERVAAIGAGFATIFSTTFILLITAKSTTAATAVANPGSLLHSGAKAFGASMNGLRFTELGFDISQGDKFVEVTLPFLALDMWYAPAS